MSSWISSADADVPVYEEIASVGLEGDGGCCGGGAANEAGYQATIAGGFGNVAVAPMASIGGGAGNHALGETAVP